MHVLEHVYTWKMAVKWYNIPTAIEFVIRAIVSLNLHTKCVGAQISSPTKKLVNLAKPLSNLTNEENVWSIIYID